jgi:serine/threonine protein kinase
MNAGAIAHMDTVEAPTKSRPRRAVAEHADLPVKCGDTLDHFTLARELGRGGMGVVFLARDTSLDRDVAIKVIVPKRDDAKSLERFFREARAQAKLSSPHVVRVFFFG